MFGGNVDNWRLGPGAAMAYPVFAEGGGLYVGDPHFAQGDGEIAGGRTIAAINSKLLSGINGGVGVHAGPAGVQVEI